jgi:hypothetical protein
MMSAQFAGIHHWFTGEVDALSLSSCCTALAFSQSHIRLQSGRRAQTVGAATGPVYATAAWVEAGHEHFHQISQGKARRRF